MVFCLFVCFLWWYAWPVFAIHILSSVPKNYTLWLRKIISYPTSKLKNLKIKKSFKRFYFAIFGLVTASSVAWPFWWNTPSLIQPSESYMSNTGWLSGWFSFSSQRRETEPYRGCLSSSISDTYSGMT